MVEHAAVYLVGGAPSTEWFLSRAGVEECVVDEDDTGAPVQYRVRFMGQTFVLNVARSRELSEQIAGLSRFVMQAHMKRPYTNTVAVMEKIAETRCAIGCVIEDGFDEAGYVGGFLTDMVKEFDGLLFARDSIFDATGNPIIGLLATE